MLHVHAWAWLRRQLSVVSDKLPRACNAAANSKLVLSSSTLKESGSCSRGPGPKHSCLFHVPFNSSSTWSVHLNVHAEKCVTPAPSADFITRSTVSLAVLLVESTSPNLAVGHTKPHHLSATWLLVLPLPIFMDSNQIPFHWNCNQGPFVSMRPCRLHTATLC